MSRPTKNRTGIRFGRLVVSRMERLVGVGWFCICRCDCGKEIRVTGTNLDSGNTRSCGCLLIDTRTTHGLTKSRVYVIWKAMHQRCENPNTFGYQNYGGRGIKVCARWSGDGGFENFLEDMGHPPDGLTIDRNNNDGNYEPGNCRWATYTEQLNNRRSNRYLTARGKTQSMTMWSRELGIPVTTIRNRIMRAGMSHEDALFGHPEKGKRYKP